MQINLNIFRTVEESMSCPRNRHGQPKCHITAHPDHPQDKFCSTCGQRFQEANYFRDIVFLTSILLAVIILNLVRVSSSPPPQSPRPISNINNYRWVDLIHRDH
ncbi:conserved hypothetical protein [Planktothrix serta PCC 8927]|uniref:Uncharacterized protein n=2 Tax=Planktothrix TaxID=54304 RepID=A0A7Z9E582_9CYAN|nr:conserved hypothetical protein [Planktothrix serta PCC 8927]